MSGENKFLIDVRFQTRTERTSRVMDIAEAFGIGLEEKEFVVFDNLELEVSPGDVVYITGQSGAGKSVLLRELARLHAERGKTVANLDHQELLDVALIDQIGYDTNNGIDWLGKAGIGDAAIWTNRPSTLSDGQRYRLRLAKAMESDADVWVADEFLAVLDRVSAKVIAASVQKIARRLGKTLIVATTHSDMVPDLAPSLYIEKRFREKVSVQLKPIP